MSLIAPNKNARREYDIASTYEAGIVLTGDEVKSCKAGQVNLKGSYATITAAGLPFLIGCHISPYKKSARREKYDPTRSRLLLLRKKEIATLVGKLKEKQYTLVPLSLHNKAGLVKVELGLGRGKKQFEKRAAIKKRDIEREIGQRLKH